MHKMQNKKEYLMVCSHTNVSCYFSLKEGGCRWVWGEVDIKDLGECRIVEKRRWEVTEMRKI